jgi:hypothetical protein
MEFSFVTVMPVRLTNGLDTPVLETPGLYCDEEGRIEGREVWRGAS